MKELIKYIIVKIITIEAKLILNKHKPFIIGITGNLGKTSTKDSVVAALSDLQVRGTEKSLDSEFGVPLTVIGEKSGWGNILKWFYVIYRGVCVYFGTTYPKYLVLEIGADHKGDIESVTKWVKTDITILTQFSEIPVHVENFANREELVREKQFLAEAVKEGGVFIYNSDCKDSRGIAEKINRKKISFGIHSGDWVAKNIKNSLSVPGVTAEVYSDGDKKLDLSCDGVLGDSPILCALPAIIVASKLKVNLDNAAAHIHNMKRAAGRMRVLEGKDNTIIIDDTYNASPLATEHGLHTLGQLDAKRKIAVLGDMLELGEYTKEAHTKAGSVAAKNAHILFTVGNRARHIAEGALDNGMNGEAVIQCENSRDAGREVLKILQAGDVVYLKGSQGMRMERAVKMLLADHIDPHQHLVRQEEEWLKR